MKSLYQWPGATGESCFLLVPYKLEARTITCVQWIQHQTKYLMLPRKYQKAKRQRTSIEDLHRLTP